MPTYVTLVNWTDQGLRNVKDTVERLDRGVETAEKYGAKPQQTYWTVDPYDMIFIPAPETPKWSPFGFTKQFV